MENACALSDVIVFVYAESVIGLKRFLPRDATL